MIMSLFVVLALSLVTPLGLAGPAAAQIILDDLPSDDGPGGGGGADFPGCSACCAQNPDWFCKGEFGCDCGPGPGFCPAAAALSVAKVAPDERTAISNSMTAAARRLFGSGQGRRLAWTLASQNRRLEQIYAADPALRARIGQALADSWPARLNVANAASVAADKSSMSPEALAEARAILADAAAADEAMGTSGLAAAIRDEVLPRLGDHLVGKSYSDAFACFVEGAC